MLEKIIRCCCLTLIVMAAFSNGNGFAGNPPIDYLGVTIGNIAYLGNDKYKITIEISNPSKRTLVLKEYSGTFQVQTEILGRWKELSARCDKGDRDEKLAPLKAHMTVCVLIIPSDIPDIYTNSEGDMNMMIKYQVRFVSGSRAGLRSYYGESSYWITPKSDKWILREGM